MKSSPFNSALQMIVMAFLSIILFGCNSSEDQSPTIEENRLYFDFTIDGQSFKSEIKVENLIPGTPNENLENPSQGQNFMGYFFYSNIIWINYGNDCGTSEGKDCLHFQIDIPENFTVGTYPSIFTYGIAVNGKNYVQRYNGPEMSPRPTDLSFDLTVSKIDLEKNIIEGSIKGLLYGVQDPSAKTYPLEGNFRVYYFKPS